MSISDKLVSIAQNEVRVYEAGKRAGSQEYNTFWDVYQQNGERTEYEYAFGGKGWSAQTFLPKYDIKPRECYMMFGRNNITDIQDLAEKSGINVDFSNARELLYLLYTNNTTKRIGVVDTKSVESYYGIFSSAYALETIDKLVLHDKNYPFESTFSGCESLRNLTIEGVIKQDGLDLSYSPLSKESIISVIDALDSNYAYSVTFRESAVNKAFETSEGALDGSESDEWVIRTMEKHDWTFNLINS